MDRSLFLKKIRPKSFGLFNGRTGKARDEAINDILDAFELYGDGRQKSLAYILATVRREVGAGMVPVREGFGRTDAASRKIVAKRKYGRPAGPYGHVYYGRGYVQLTWHGNYVESSADAGVDLEKYPDEMLKSDIAAKITVMGILDGRFNGARKGLAHYLPDEGPDDLKNARRTVNGTDHWEEIAGHYHKFKKAIEIAGGVPVGESPVVAHEDSDHDDRVVPSQAGETRSIEDLISTIDPEESLSSDKILVSNKGERNLPTYRPTQKTAITMGALEKFSHLVPEAHSQDKVFVLAVRGYYTDTMGKPGANDRGIYDDAMFVVEPNQVYNFNGNTDPSSRAYKRAVLKSPQCVVYKPGLHGYKSGNPYPAFRQHSPVSVVRDGYGEDSDAGKDFFWINLHRGGARTTSSAGCQTVPVNQWLEFKTLVDSLLEKHGQETFCYILIDEKDVPDAEETIVIYNKHDKSRLREGEAMADNNTGGTKAGDGSIVPENLDAALVMLARELLERRRDKVEAIPDGNKDDEARKALYAMIFKLIGEKPGEGLVTAEDLPIRNALGKGIGNLLDGRKTGISVIGGLATILLPVLFGENGTAILQAFDLGAPSGAESTSNGATVLGTLFGGLGIWGILGKIEKWVKIVKQR